MFYTAKIQKIIESRKFLADLFGYIAFFYYLCTIFNTISAYKYKYIYKNISIRLIKKYNSWQSHIKYLIKLYEKKYKDHRHRQP